jgi:glycosyltransferase involved in cell wall biosynthesis
MLLEIAHRRKIPVVIQHAGIWKKELQFAKKYFSNAIRRLFISYEKEVIKKSNHQIFLNQYSLDIFFKIHHISKNKKTLHKTSIIPLPTETKIVKKINLSDKTTYTIGLVARWDGIKNHDAIVRLANYIRQNNLPFKIKAVTKWPAKNNSSFRKKYEKLIEVIAPMQPDKLRIFLSSLDILILPSRFDSCGAVVMESIICGTPVVISDSVGWVNDYHKNGLDKLIFSPQASGLKIYQTIDELIHNKKKYIPLFSKLQKQILKENNIESVFKIYQKILTKIIN